MATADDAVRNYLLALREPEALKDDTALQSLNEQLAAEEDPIGRLRLRQQVLEAQQVDPKRYESDFITHARTWADSKGVSHAAFQAEGVPDSVLRKAGFSPRRGAAGRRRGGGGGRTRVSAEEVRTAIPKDSFTIKDVQDASGASMAVVRRVVQEELEAGNVTAKGSDPEHRGPGRAPTLYHKP